jgi:archaeosortase A (PGF-CTERM-specific)
MIGQFVDAFAAFGSIAKPIGWLTLAVFLLAVAAEYVDRESARRLFVVAWVLFAVFWLSLLHPYLAVDHSFVKGIGAMVAAPLSVLVAKEFYEGRDSLFTLSRAIAFMGLIYAPFVMITPVREQLVLIVTDQTAWAMSLLGVDPPVVTELSELSHLPGIGPEDEISGKENAFENSFVFLGEDYRVTYSIIIACTGIGSMAVMGGLVTAVRAPLSRKLQALAIALPIIYVLNLVRNVFIAINYGEQRMHLFPDLTMAVFGVDNTLRVSYLWADRILAQVGSVVAMVLILWLIVRVLPEVMQPVEEVLYLLTGNEYDLAEALDLGNDDGQPTAAD